MILYDPNALRIDSTYQNSPSRFNFRCGRYYLTTLYCNPTPAHHRHLFCVRFVQGCIINDQNTFGFQDKLFNLLPECLAIWWNALKQTRIGVMRRRANFSRCNLRCFHCAKYTLSCQQELDVIVFVYFLRVHSLSLISLFQLRKSYHYKFRKTI